LPVTGFEDDRLAINNQLGRFARILDGRNWEAVGEVFAGDVTFEGMSPSITETAARSPVSQRSPSSSGAISTCAARRSTCSEA
jgi:hypothetical protein